jgi:hypothetical protein
VLITHEPVVAERAKRTIRLQDGLIVSDRRNNRDRPLSNDLRTEATAPAAEGAL